MKFLEAVIVYAKWLPSKTVTPVISPQRTAGEPNYEVAVVPQFIFCVPRAHTLLGFTVCKAATAQHSYSELYSVFALHAVWGARVAAGEEVV